MIAGRLRYRLLAALSAIACLIVVPLLCFTLLNIGPATRVVYYEYLPIEELAIFLTSAVTGATLGAQVPRWVRRASPSVAARGFQTLGAIGLVFLFGWIGITQLRAFPAAASVADRDSWARVNVPQYRALTRIVSAIPEVQRDVGRVVAIAPTATDQHRAAREMNGDDMRFALDVIGERGRGIFYADCTLDEDRIYDWRSGRWLANDREVAIGRPAVTRP